MNPEYLSILRAMTPAQKLRAAQRLYYTAREIKAAGLRLHHPEWTDEQIQAAVREAFIYVRT